MTRRRYRWRDTLAALGGLTPAEGYAWPSEAGGWFGVRTDVQAYRDQLDRMVVINRKLTAELSRAVIKCGQLRVDIETLQDTIRQMKADCAANHMPRPELPPRPRR